MNLHRAQRSHVPMALPRPPHADGRAVAHELEDGAGRRTLAGGWAIGQGFPACCQTIPDLPLDQRVQQQRDQVHIAQGCHACGGLQEDAAMAAGFLAHLKLSSTAGCLS